MFLFFHTNHQPTPYSRVLPDKLTGPQLVKKFPSFYGTRKFITAFTSTDHLFLSSARAIHSMLTHPPSWKIHFNIILPLRLSLSNGLFPLGLPTKTLHSPLPSPIRSTSPAHLILLISHNLTKLNLRGQLAGTLRCKASLPVGAVINILSLHDIWFGFPKEFQFIYGRFKETSKRSNNTARNNTFFTVGVQFSQKPNGHLKILGARMLTRTKFHSEGPQILSVTAQNLVAQVTWCPLCVHPRISE